MTLNVTGVFERKPQQAANIGQEILVDYITRESTIVIFCGIIKSVTHF